MTAEPGLLRTREELGPEIWAALEDWRAGQHKGNGHAQGGLRGQDFVDITPCLTASYVVKNLLSQSSLAAIIGASGSGKSFFAIDLGCHVAAGLPWRGHRVTRGLVIYASLEGGGSARNRFSAWRSRHSQNTALPLRLMTQGINLRDLEHAMALTEFTLAAESAHGEKAALVIIDTLSRAMAGGNENAPDDMGALIAGADSIRETTGACVLLVHHLGKDESRGARGHTSLKAALDTEIEISRAGNIRLATVTKQRDWPEGDGFAFTLDVVDLGQDDDTDRVTSCVALASDDLPDTRRQPGGKNQSSLLAALQEWRRANGRDLISTIELRAVAKEQKLAQKRLSEALAGLERSGWLGPCLGGYKLLEASSE